MITTNTGAKKIENSDNWREIFDAHNTSVDAADRIQPEVAPIINGKQCALSVAVGNFVLLRNSTISGKADGAYEVTKAIPANTNLDSTYIANNPIGGGIANELNNKMANFSIILDNISGSTEKEKIVNACIAFRALNTDNVKTHPISIGTGASGLMRRYYNDVVGFFVAFENNSYFGYYNTSNQETMVHQITANII